MANGIAEAVPKLMLPRCHDLQFNAGCDQVRTIRHGRLNCFKYPPNYASLVRFRDKSLGLRSTRNGRYFIYSMGSGASASFGLLSLLWFAFLVVLFFLLATEMSILLPWNSLPCMEFIACRASSVLLNSTKANLKILCRWNNAHSCHSRNWLANPLDFFVFGSWMTLMLLESGNALLSISLVAMNGSCFTNRHVDTRKESHFKIKKL